MLEKKIKYSDYNDNEREETFRFDLSKAELLEMELSTNGGLEQFINRIVSTQDGPQLFKLFKELILKSYGVKSDDGKRFVKSEELAKEFEQSPAFSELMMELISNADLCAEFIKGIVPQDISAQAAQISADKVVSIDEVK